MERAAGEEYAHQMAVFISNSAILSAIRPRIRACDRGSDRFWARKMAEFRAKSDILRVAVVTSRPQLANRFEDD